MKYMISVLALTALFSTSVLAAHQITDEEVSNYSKIGDLSFSQDGLPAVGHEQFSEKADEKCKTLGDISPENCYYKVVAAVGDDTNFKNINLELFKKK